MAAWAAQGLCCSKCWVSASEADFHLITAQPSLGQGAGLLHICSLSDGKDHKSVLEKKEARPFRFCKSKHVFSTEFVYA